MKGHLYVTNEPLLHDVSFAGAHAVFGLVEHAFPEAQQRQIFADLYNAFRAGIEAFCIQSEREAKKITPSKN